MAAQSFHVIKCAKSERRGFKSNQSTCCVTQWKVDIRCIFKVSDAWGKWEKISEIKNTSIFFLHARFGHAEHQNYCDAIEMILYLLSTRFLTSVAAHDLCTQGNPQTMSLCQSRQSWLDLWLDQLESLFAQAEFILYVRFPVTMYLLLSKELVENLLDFLFV